MTDKQHEKQNNFGDVNNDDNINTEIVVSQPDSMFQNQFINIRSSTPHLQKRATSNSQHPSNLQQHPHNQSLHPHQQLIINNTEQRNSPVLKFKNKKENDDNFLQYNTQIQQSKYSTFIKSNFNHIYIEDNYIPRSRTADFNQRKGLPLQNVFLEIDRQMETHEKILPRSIHSRENLHRNNKKYQKIRAEQYPHKKNHDLNVQFQATDKKNIQMKGFAKGLSLQNSPPKANAGKSKFRSYSTTSLNRKNAADTLNSGRKNNSASFKKKEKKDQAQMISQIQPHKFTTKIKTKAIDDNPNILANIIRKKVGIMERDQLFEYLHKIMNKGGHRR